MKLTDNKIKALKPIGKAKKHYCNSIPNFGVVVHPTGKKSFFLEYRFLNRRRKLTIGCASSLSISRAREIASEAIASIAEGVDPSETKSKLIHGETVQTLLDFYLKEHCERFKRSSNEDILRVDRICDKFKKLSLGQVNRNDVLDLHKRKSKTAPYEANRQIELLKGAFKFGIIRGLFGGKNPCDDIRPNKETSRDRWLTPDEFEVIWRKADEEANWSAGKAIQFLMSTGIRCHEATQAEWKQVYWDVKSFYVLGKGGKNRHISLNSFALEILENMPKIIGNKFIFPGNVKGRPIVNIRKPWLRIKAEAMKEKPELEDVRIHDLRRTAASWLTQADIPFNHVGDYLGHSSKRITEIYARTSNTTMQKTSAAMGKLMSNALNKD